MTARESHAELGRLYRALPSLLAARVPVQVVEPHTGACHRPPASPPRTPPTNSIHCQNCTYTCLDPVKPYLTYPSPLTSPRLHLHHIQHFAPQSLSAIPTTRKPPRLQSFTTTASEKDTRHTPPASILRLRPHQRQPHVFVLCTARAYTPIESLWAGPPGHTHPLRDDVYP